MLFGQKTGVGAGLPFDFTALQIIAPAVLTRGEFLKLILKYRYISMSCDPLAGKPPSR